MRRGIQVDVGKEPTNGPIGAEIRKAIEGRTTLHPRVLALAFAADRADHILNEHTGVLRSLDHGRWVLSDRYLLSTLAYQLSADLDEDWLRAINRYAFTPDVTVFIDTPADECLERLGLKSSHLELFHKQEELERVAQNYARLVRQGDLTGYLIKVRGDADEDEVFMTIVEGIEHWTSRVGVALPEDRRAAARVEPRS